MLETDANDAAVLPVCTIGYIFINVFNLDDKVAYA